MVSTGAFAQGQGPDLVRNGGFDELTGKVRTWDKVSAASGWSNANGGSVDVFSKDACTGNVGIPENALGSATAFDGEHYAGFVAWKDDQRRNWDRLLNGRDAAPFKEAWNRYSEYLQVPLSGPLKAGEKYAVSMRVSLADNSDRAVSGIGMYLSPVMLAEGHRHFLDVKPQVASDKVISDRADWVEITGEFIAEGGEQYAVIGAFPSAGMRKEMAVQGGDSQRAYYYIDGVSVKIAPEPDADGDGVPDKEDNCPNEPGKADLGGCPDRDGDGVADKMDACPDLAGPVDKQGCPDSDGDGIADNMDKCPTVAGVPEMKGCPAVKEEVKRLFEKALTGIQFETGSAVIKKSSHAILDDVVAVLADNPSYDLEVHGHTDSQGNDEKNMKLSEERAASVKDFLVGKGVAGDRLKSFGHGETMPVADNATSTGRAKNRRVEFKVMFWDR